MKGTYHNAFRSFWNIKVIRPVLDQSDPLLAVVLALCYLGVAVICGCSVGGPCALLHYSEGAESRRCFWGSVKSHFQCGDRVERAVFFEIGRVTIIVTWDSRTSHSFS